MRPPVPPQGHEREGFGHGDQICAVSLWRRALLAGVAPAYAESDCILDRCADRPPQQNLPTGGRSGEISTSMSWRSPGRRAFAKDASKRRRAMRAGGAIAALCCMACGRNMSTVSRRNAVLGRPRRARRSSARAGSIPSKGSRVTNGESTEPAPASRQATISTPRRAPRRWSRRHKSSPPSHRMRRSARARSSAHSSRQIRGCGPAC